MVVELKIRKQTATSGRLVTRVRHLWLDPDLSPNGCIIINPPVGGRSQILHVHKSVDQHRQIFQSFQAEVAYHICARSPLLYLHVLFVSTGPTILNELFTSHPNDATRRRAEGHDCRGVFLGG